MRTILAARQLSTYSTANTTFFLDPVAVSRSRTSGEVNAQFRMPFAGTLRNLRALVFSNARGTTSTLRIRKNGANGNLEVPIGAGVTGNVEDTANSDAIAAGDLINFALTNGSGSGGLSISLIQVDFEAADGKSHYFHCFLADEGVNASFNTERWIQTFGYARTFVISWASTNTTKSRTYIAADAILSNLRVNTILNTYDADVTIEIYKNGSPTGVKVIIPAGVTGETLDTTNTVAVARGDYVHFHYSAPGRTSGSFRPSHIEMSLEDTGDKQWSLTVTAAENANPLITAPDTRYSYAAGGDMDYLSSPPAGGVKLFEEALAVHLNGTSGQNYAGGTVTLLADGSDTGLAATVTSTNSPFSDDGSVTLDEGVSLTYSQEITDGSNSNLANMMALAISPVPADEVLVPKGSLILTGYAPVLSGDLVVDIDPGELVITGYPPVVTTSATAIVPKGSLVIQGYAPLVKIGTVILSTGKDSLLLEGYAPAIFSDLAGFVSELSVMSLTSADPDMASSQLSLSALCKVIPESEWSNQTLLILAKVIPPTKFTQLSVQFLHKSIIQMAVLPEPEDQIVETWEWFTDVIRSNDGKEQRISLRDYPRRSFSETIAFDDEDLLNRQLQFMLQNFGDKFIVPLFQYQTRLTAPAKAGDAVVMFDPTRTELREGDHAYIHAANGFQLVRIMELLADSARVDIPMLKDYVRPVIMPGSVCVAANNTNFQRRNVDDSGFFTLNASETDPLMPFVRDTNTEVLEEYDGLPVLDFRPVGSQFDTAFDTGIELVDFDTGNVEVRNTWKNGQNQFSRTFLFQRSQADAFDKWKVFGDTVKGAQKPFLIPSYREDFRIVTPAAAGSDRIVVDGIKYAPTYFGREAFRRIAITTDAGVHYATVWSAARDGTTNVLYFSPPFPAGEGWDQNQKVSFLIQCRIADDRIRFEHHTTYSYVGMTLRTVDDL